MSALALSVAGDALCLKQYSRNMSSLTLQGPTKLSTITLQEPLPQLMEFEWAIPVSGLKRLALLLHAHTPIAR